MTCEHCGRADHTAKAHHDPEAALIAGDEALANGDRTGAMLWYRVATKLARQQTRYSRGMRGC